MINATLIVLIAGIISGEANQNPQSFLYGICTVHSRIESGWTPEKVMDQYYAEFTEPEPWEIAVTNSVLNSPNDCPKVYFMYSQEDTENLFREFTYHSKICDTSGSCNVFMTKEDFRAATFN